MTRAADQSGARQIMHDGAAAISETLDDGRVAETRLPRLYDLVPLESRWRERGAVAAAIVGLAAMLAFVASSPPAYSYYDEAGHIRDYVTAPAERWTYQLLPADTQRGFVPSVTAVVDAGPTLVVLGIVGSAGGEVVALDRTTGKEHWRVPANVGDTAAQGIACEGSTRDDTVMCVMTLGLGTHPQLTRFDLGSGEAVASARLLASGDTLRVLRGTRGDTYVVESSADHTWIERFTGRELKRSWRRQVAETDANTWISAYIAAVNDGVITEFDDDGWGVIDADTGDEVVRFDVAGSMFEMSLAVVDGDRARVVTYSDRSITMYTAAGDLQWQADGVLPLVPPQQSRGLVVGMDPVADDLVALDIATGAERWRVPDEDYASRLFAVTPTVVVIANSVGTDLIALSPSTGARIWDSDMTGFGPVYSYLSDTYIYLQSGTGQIRAYDLASGAIAWTSAARLAWLVAVGPDLVAIDNDTISMLR